MTGKYRNQTYTVHVQESDQRRIQHFSMHELAFYNTIVENLESRTRAFPEQVAALTSEQIDKLCACVKQNVSKPDNLPAWLDHVFTQILKPKLAVIPETKSLMVKSLFEFFRDQATILKDPVMNPKLEIAYKTTPQNLSKQDKTTKRHVQIPRSQVQIKYDHTTESTLIRTPVTVHELEIPGVNLNERDGWHMMVIRQEPGRWCTVDTPWMVEFRHTNNQYLIKLTDAGAARR